MFRIALAYRVEFIALVALGFYVQGKSSVTNGIALCEYLSYNNRIVSLKDQILIIMILLTPPPPCAVVDGHLFRGCVYLRKPKEGIQSI